MTSGTVWVTSRSFASGTDTPRRVRLPVVRGDPAHDAGRLTPHLLQTVGWIAGTAPDGPRAAEEVLRAIDEWPASSAVVAPAVAETGARTTSDPGFGPAAANGPDATP